MNAKNQEPSMERRDPGWALADEPAAAELREDGRPGRVALRALERPQPAAVRPIEDREGGDVG